VVDLANWLVIQTLTRINKVGGNHSMTMSHKFCN